MSSVNKSLLKAMLKKIDEQLKMVRLDEEGEEQSKRLSAKDMMAKDYEALFGVRPSDRHLSTVPRISRYASVAIDPIYSFLRDDASGKRVIDHAILKETIEQNYFVYKSAKSKIPAGADLSDEDIARLSIKKELEPSPIMIWGAPGIGKSQGVLAGAINCAKKVAAKNNQQFQYLDEDDIEEVFARPVEEHKGKLYFLAWNDAQKKEKEATIFGKMSYDESGNPVYDSRLKIPAENLFIFFDVRVAGIPDGDLLGIPMRVDKTIITPKGGKITEPTLNMDRLPFLKMCCEEKKLHGVIMWDEINQGSDGVKSALYSVICERRVGTDARLAPGIANFAAANGEYWGGGSLPKALGDRFGLNYLYVSPAEWIETFKKKGMLKPLMEKFIRQNPLVSFYMTEEGWEKFYVPTFANVENRPNTMKEYILSEDKKFPSPRNLLKVAEFINDKLAQIQSGELDWDTAQLSDSISAFAGEWCGPVFEEQFRDFIFKWFAVKWDVMVENQEYAVQQATDMESQDIVRTLIKDHFKELITLSMSIYSSTPGSSKDVKHYKTLLEEVMRVLVNIASSEVDFLVATLRDAREEYIAENKTGDDGNDRIRTEKAISQIIKDGKVIVPDPAWQAKAEKTIKDVLNALIELARAEAEASRGASKLVAQPEEKTPQIQKQQTQTTPPSDDSTLTTATSSIPEKYIRFNMVFEELNNKYTVKPPQAPIEEIEPNVQKRAIASIIQSVVGKDGSLTTNGTDDIKSRNTDILDKINYAILNNTQLTKRQKQKLISVIKHIPEAISVLLVLKGYETNTYKL